MKGKTILVALIPLAMLAPVVGAVDLGTTPTPDFLYEAMGMLPADFTCENGAHTYSFPDPLHAGVTVSVDILCPASDELAEILTATDAMTDCPGTSYSLWQGQATIPWQYTYDTTNPFGFSQSAVASAWDSANAAWDSQVAATLFGGHTFGGTSASSGTYDQYILAEFGYYSGQLRTAIGVQWAWASGGKIVHTDAGYNTRYSFALGAASGKYDVQNIATHEMGHGYGLGHSDTSTASQCLTLYPYGYTNDISKRTLGDGDILGIRARGY